MPNNPTTTSTSGTVRERLVDAAGHLIHVVENGPHTGPPLLLLHGHAGSTAWWDQVAPQLAAEHRVIRVDLLGHGRSDKPATGYTMVEQANVVGLVLDALRVPKVTAIGHATGAVVSVALAEQRPDLVTALVLIDTGPDVGAFLRPSGLGQLVEVRGIGRLLWAVRSTATIRRGLESAFTRKIAIPPQIISDVRTMRYRTIVATPKETKAFMVRRGLPDRLADLRLPTLVIFGVEDRRYRSSSVDQFGVVPDLAVELIPGVGHSPMLEDPNRTAQLLTGFLRRLAKDMPDGAH